MGNINMIYSNVEEIVKQEYHRLANNKTRFKQGDVLDIFFNDYRDWIEYEAFLETFLIQYGNIATRSIIGQTIQGRNIPLITLSTGGSTNKPGFYIQAELHAREWLANAATTWIMNELAEKYTAGDEVVTQILNNVNIFIAPTVNIDGYIYSWTNNRFWRKNRRHNGGTSFGVDLNRNYLAPMWCQVGASTDPNSNTYCGTAPFSEPEAAATRDFILDESNNIRAGFDMHTFGPLILWPWFYTYDRAPDYDYLVEYGAELRDAVVAVNGHFYTSQQSADLYPAAGACDDFFYVNGIINSITFEGRGPGFDPPASNIIPAGEEQYAAVISTAQRLFNVNKFV